MNGIHCFLKAITKFFGERIGRNQKVAHFSPMGSELVVEVCIGALCHLVDLSLLEKLVDGLEHWVLCEEVLVFFVNGFVDLIEVHACLARFAVYVVLEQSDDELLELVSLVPDLIHVVL